MRRLMIAALALALLAGVASAQADISGKWELTIIDPLSLTHVNPLTLEQDGDDLDGVLGEFPIRGSVDGSEILMIQDVPESSAGALVLTFEGQISGDRMSGAVTFGTLASGSVVG